MDISEEIRKNVGVTSDDADDDAFAKVSMVPVMNFITRLAGNSPTSLQNPVRKFASASQPIHFEHKKCLKMKTCMSRPDMNGQDTNFL